MVRQGLHPKPILIPEPALFLCHMQSTREGLGGRGRGGGGVWTGRLLPQEQHPRRNADSTRNPKSNFLTLGKWPVVWPGMLSVGAVGGVLSGPSPVPISDTLCHSWNLSRSQVEETLETPQPCCSCESLGD